MNAVSKRRIHWLSLGVAALSLACHKEAYTAKLVTGDEVQLARAVKGHELVVQKNAELARIRLVGIYTFDPKVVEKNDVTVWANNAVGFMKARMENRPVRIVLEREEVDRRGRYLGFVEVDGVDLGQQLVEQGHAAVYTEFPFSREADYLTAEATAREGVRGLWGGTAAARRLRALRATWSTMRERGFASRPNDPLLGAQTEW